MMRDLNELPRPRVLVHVSGRSKAAAAVDALEDLAGTVRVVEDIDEVHLDEWDALITSSGLGRKVYPGGPRKAYLNRWVPEHLYVVVLQSRTQGFCDYTASDAGELMLQLSEMESVGARAVMGDGLDDEVAALVKAQLVPVVAERSDQFGLRVTSPSGENTVEYGEFKPLLLGPDSLVYAAHYDRAPGSPVWLLPDDVPDLLPWFKHIFKSWHELKPDVYRGAPDWYEADDWMVPAEFQKADELSAEVASFEQLRSAHRERKARIEAELGKLRDETARAERILLGGQDFELQEQVLKVLEELGFDVEDMDPTWHEKEPREDYRIRDVSDPTWMVIGDATGTTKGVRGTKLMTVERYVTKYVQEHPGDAIPKYWVIANHFARRAPSERPTDLLRKDELSVVKKDGNLVLDTVALFLLLVAARRDTALKEAIRAELRSRSGQFTAEDARTWIAAQ
ncbi:hypothetical protein ACIP5T_08235 [Microbacterium sp. NPDC088619]|uniref:hypothetical protein n=1 Tax=Microbacterium sp. NPDC088619 TaxID=3364196 RepID=UPI00380B1F4C